jgi:hypothetical protein
LERAAARLDILVCRRAQGRRRSLPNALLAPRLRLDLTNGLFQRYLSGLDVGLVKRRLHPTHLRNKGDPGAAVQPPPRFSSVRIERAYGLGNYRIIVTHSGDQG